MIQSGAGSWSGSFPAPTAGGTYHYTFGIYSRSGSRLLQDNDGWSLTVSAPAPTAQAAQALPPDIPLAPPFSYGNPVGTTFTAEGQTVHGSVVAGSTPARVDPSAVSQFYVNHLPRAGWTVDQSTVPAPGATSVSLAATKPGPTGTEVCLVQYSASSIRIFYGTSAG